MKDYIRLLRPRHCIKNLLIFFPMFFAKEARNIGMWGWAVYGFIIFSVAASGIYVINDIMDADRDRLHPQKKNRPIASGRISKTHAWLIFIMCTFASLILSALPYFLASEKNAGYATGLLAVYIVTNIAYSCGLKNIPILDVSLLSLGYVIRIYYGGFITGIEISDWLFLVVTAGALYMGFGKRRGELKAGKDTRKVLKVYTQSFLEQAMSLMMGLAIVFYALWARDIDNSYMIFTVPLFMLIVLRYSMACEKLAEGDPVEVILGDLPLIVMLFIYGLTVVLMMYYPAR